MTCHRFPGAKLAEPCPFLQDGPSVRVDEVLKAPEILLSKLRIKKRGQVPAVHGATFRVPFRDFPAVGLVSSRKSSSALNLSGFWRPAGAGFAVILTAKSNAVGTTASRHSQDGCVPIHDSEVALFPDWTPRSKIQTGNQLGKQIGNAILGGAELQDYPLSCPPSLLYMDPDIKLNQPALWCRYSLVPARWLLLIIILAVAWPYGLAGSEYQPVFMLTVMGCGVLAVAGWGLRRSPPRIARHLCLLPVLLLGMGWAALVFPRAFFDETRMALESLPRPVPDWFPGTVDAASGARKTALISSYVIIFLIAGDAGSSRRWRARLGAALALAAGSVALFGLYQKSTGASNIYWQPGPPSDATFFGPFTYHANAASFMVAGLPYAVGMAILALRRPRNGAGKLLWCIVGMGIASALLVNTSRAGVWLSIGVASIMGLREGCRLWQGSGRALKARIITSGGIGVAAVCLVAMGFGWEKTLERSGWDSLGEGFKARSRAPRIALPAAADAGWFGFGPGTFKAVFPPYRLGKPELEPVTVWEHLHNDPLQTVIEWGWLGATGWALVLFLIARQGWRRLATYGGESESRVLLEAAGISFAAVFLHSLVDFPFQVPAVSVMLAAGAGLLAANANE